MRLHGFHRTASALRPVWVCTLAALSLSLYGCGGGGGGNTPAGTGQDSNPPPPSSLTASVSSITTTASTSQGGGPVLNNPISFTVPASGTYYYELSYDGTAIGTGTSSVSINGVTSTDYNTGNSAVGSDPALAYAIGATVHGSWTGTLDINSISMIAAAVLGAGVYHDSLTLHVCQDSACSNELAGSPITIPVTYTVTGATIPSGVITVYPNAEVELPGSQTSPASASITVDGSSLPPTGAYVTTGTSAKGLITKGTFSSTLATYAATQSTGRVNLTLESPSTAGVGIHTDTAPINVCFDTGCQKPAAGGPWTANLTYIVDPVAGVDYTQQTIAVSIGGLVWDSQTNVLYAIVPGYSTADPNTLAEIDPYSGGIEQTVQLNGGVGHIEPGTLAVSDDGQYLYVAVSDSTGLTDQIERIRTSDLGLDETITLATGELVATLEAAPGAPQTVAVETGGNSPELVIYDNTTPRTNTLTGQSGNTLVSFTWGANSSSIYAMLRGTSGTLNLVSVTSTGLQVTNSLSSAALQSAATLGNGMQFDGGLVCWNSGMTFDPVAFALATPFAAQTSTVPSAAFDGSLSRAYFITTDQAPGSSSETTNIEAFNFSSRGALWILRFPSQNSATQLTRWGSNGLAFADNSGGVDSLVLVSGALVTQ